LNAGVGAARGPDELDQGNQVMVSSPRRERGIGPSPARDQTRPRNSSINRAGTGLRGSSRRRCTDPSVSLASAPACDSPWAGGGDDATEETLTVFFTLLRTAAEPDTPTERLIVAHTFRCLHAPTSGPDAVVPLDPHAPRFDQVIAEPNRHAQAVQLSRACPRLPRHHRPGIPDADRALPPGRRQPDRRRAYHARLTQYLLRLSTKWPAGLGFGRRNLVDLRPDCPLRSVRLLRRIGAISEPPRSLSSRLHPCGERWSVCDGATVAAPRQVPATRAGHGCPTSI
jgi:hypothetical protein